MIIAAHHISKAFLEKPILRDVSFQIEKGEKIAVVGMNGAGKTTLLRILLGEMEPDSGTVARVRDLEIGYLAQKQNVDFSLTVREELTAVKQPLIDMEARLAEQERRMAEVTGPALEKLMEEYLLLQDRFRNENGYGWRGEVNAVLNGLGFGGEAAQQLHLIEQDHPGITTGQHLRRTAVQFGYRHAGGVLQTIQKPVQLQFAVAGRVGRQDRQFSDVHRSLLSFQALLPFRLPVPSPLPARRKRRGTKNKRDNKDGDLDSPLLYNITTMISLTPWRTKSVEPLG